MRNLKFITIGLAVLFLSGMALASDDLKNEIDESSANEDVKTILKKIVDLHTVEFPKGKNHAIVTCTPDRDQFLLRYVFVNQGTFDQRYGDYHFWKREHCEAQKEALEEVLGKKVEHGEIEVILEQKKLGICKAYFKEGAYGLQKAGLILRTTGRAPSILHFKNASKTYPEGTFYECLKAARAYSGLPTK